MKNSRDAYLRNGVPDPQQFVFIRLVEGGKDRLKRIECIDFIGMTKTHIDEAFKRFFDPQAAKKGAKNAQLKTLGGHGNGGKFYMRQMFKTSEIITYRDGKLNIFGFDANKKYGYEENFEDKTMSLVEAMKKAEIDKIELPESVKTQLENGETGFTVVRGENPHRVKNTTNRKSLIEKFALHPQARRWIARMPVMLLLNDDVRPFLLPTQEIKPKEGFEEIEILQVPAFLEWEGRTINFTNENYSWAGKLTLKTSNDPLRGKLDVLNTIDFIGEVGVIGSYRIHELGQSRFSGQTDFIYGECECPILEDPEMDSVKNDREKLISNERSDALIAWVREQVEALAERMELKNTREKKQQDLKNTSIFNDMLNDWKNRFMNQVWKEVFMGKGPAGSDGFDLGTGSGGIGGGGNGGGGNENPGGKGQEGGEEKKKRPRFPQVLVSGKDTDPLDPLATEPFQCDPRQPAIYQRTKDVEAGIYWINTSRQLAGKILDEYGADSTRWREYMFQRYIDIMIREGIFQMEKTETSLTPDNVTRKIDDLTTRIHDQAAAELTDFLFEEQFNL
ncbi:MAG: hypothetical protein ACR2GD_03680 [Pyrinomonadaceae bacterium]